MKTFVIGGTGQVGSLVAQGLQSRGHDVSVLVRDPVRSPLPSGQHAIVGDILDVSAVRAGLHVCDALFAMMPPMESLAFAGLNLIALAREAVVANTVLMTGQDCRVHLRTAHIGSLVPIEDALIQSGLDYTLLNPNYFFQNDLHHKAAILRGSYPTPIGSIGLSRCDVRDIADAAVTMLCVPGTGERLRICGREVLTGESVAATWATALGRPVHYAGHDDMAGYEAALAKIRSSAFALDMRVMYESFQQHGLRATEADLTRLTAILGRPPRTFSDFTLEVAKYWSINE